nr:MAG TPA: hypothetical protein [Caudoviricetes sp.]
MPFKSFKYSFTNKSCLVNLFHLTFYKQKTPVNLQEF